MKIKIADLKPRLVNGVDVQLPARESGYRENYFEWTASSLTGKFQTSLISGGILQAWRHTPVFREVECHEDAEMFYVMQGTALMMFMDYQNGAPDISTAQIVRLKAGTQIVIHEGKGHFVPVAEDSDPVVIVVMSPKMDAPRKILPEPVEGVL